MMPDFFQLLFSQMEKTKEQLVEKHKKNLKEMQSNLGKDYYSLIQTGKFT